MLNHFLAFLLLVPNRSQTSSFIKFFVFCSVGNWSDAGHTVRSECWKIPENHHIPTPLHRDISQDLASPPHVSGQHGVWAGGHSEPQPAYDDSTQEVLYSDDNDR